MNDLLVTLESICKAYWDDQKPKYFLSIDGVMHQLETTRLERDLGIHLADNLKWQQQCA